MMSTELIDHDVVVSWMDAHGLGAGLPLEVDTLSDGRSNVMFGLRRGDEQWVLRRPRKVAVDRADDLMRREFRLLSALNGTAVPHAAAIAICEDPTLLGCVFYLMSRVDGFAPVGPLPDSLADAREPLAHAMIDALVTLHAVDWRAIGLADFGKPGGFHQRQVSRWLGQLDSYEGRDLPELRRVAELLEQQQPADYAPAIMHGDYHILNVIMAPDRPARVSAIVDWETSTIGDPLLDVVGFLEVYAQACPTDQGWPHPDALWARYAEATGRDAAAPTAYYLALYNFRMAVLMEGIYQRSLRDPQGSPSQDVADQVAHCTRRAVEAFEGATA